MAKLEVRQHTTNRRKKRDVPLARLQTPDAVKTVLRHPRRLTELLDMLSDKDLGVRGRAAATLAQLAESRPERLLKVMPRLEESLQDDSDYVRWHLVYAFGEVCLYLPGNARHYWKALVAATNDNCRVARLLAGKAMGRISARYPDETTELLRQQRTSPSEKNPQALPETETVAVA